MTTRNSAIHVAGLVLLAGCQTETVDDVSQALVTNVHVDDSAPPGGNGSPGSPFDNLPDAVDHAGGLGGDIVIQIAPGVYELTTTLTVDFPVTFQGSNQMSDDADGWPIPLIAVGTETIILSTPTLGTNTMVKVGSETGPVIDGLVAFRNLTFDLDANFGIALHIVKSHDFEVRRNVFRGEGGNIGVFPVASSGIIAGNHLNVGAGISVNAGTPASPANVEVTGNRAVGNTFGGLLLNGSGFDLPETDADQLDVVVTDNDLSLNTAGPSSSFGIRVFLIRRDPGRPGDDQDTGNVTALIADNQIVGNSLGMVLDAGFPFRKFVRNNMVLCDERVYHGSFDLDLTGNDLSGSSFAPALISFTRISATTDPATQLDDWQFLHDTTYTVSDPDESLDGFVLDHPANDRFTGGPCLADDFPEPLDNTLVYNGVTVPNN